MEIKKNYLGYYVFDKNRKLTGSLGKNDAFKIRKALERLKRHKEFFNRIKEIRNKMHDSKESS